MRGRQVLVLTVLCAVFVAGACGNAPAASPAPPTATAPPSLPPPSSPNPAPSASPALPAPSATADASPSPTQTLIPMADLLAQCPADSATKKPTEADVRASGAQGGAFTPKVIQAPACTPIEITFTNAGAEFGVFNNIAIPYGRDEWLFQGDKATTADPVTYVIPPLPAGSYRFLSQAKRSLSGTIEILPD